MLEQITSSLGLNGLPTPGIQLICIPIWIGMVIGVGWFIQDWWRHDRKVYHCDHGPWIYDVQGWTCGGYSKVRGCPKCGRMQMLLPRTCRAGEWVPYRIDRNIIRRPDALETSEANS